MLYISLTIIFVPYQWFYKTTNNLLFDAVNIVMNVLYISYKTDHMLSICEPFNALKTQLKCAHTILLQHETLYRVHITLKNW